MSLFEKVLVSHVALALYVVQAISTELAATLLVFTQQDNLYFVLDLIGIAFFDKSARVTHEVLFILILHATVVVDNLSVLAHVLVTAVSNSVLHHAATCVE